MSGTAGQHHQLKTGLLTGRDTDDPSRVCDARGLGVTMGAVVSAVLVCGGLVCLLASCWWDYGLRATSD